MKTPPKICPKTGHMTGDDRVETHFMHRGSPTKRIHVDIKFDKDKAVKGETVTILGVPDDAFLLYKNEMTTDRSFVMEGESVRVHLMGKYRGMARCIRASEKTIENDKLIQAMLENFKKTPEGQAIVAALKNQ
jgi:hypothetical protein